MPELVKPPPAIAAGAAAVFAAVTTAAALLLTPAAAQRAKPVPQAFAAVQAPETAVETCHSTSAQAALDCARRRCQRNASRGACFAVTTCEPAGWAGVMGVQLTETHFSSTICGAPTRDALLEALRAFCRGQTGLRQCAVTRLWAPDGNLLILDQTWTPADLKP